MKVGQVFLTLISIMGSFKLYEHIFANNSSPLQSEDPSNTIVIERQGLNIQNDYFNYLIEDLVDNNPKSKTATRLILQFDDNQITSLQALSKIGQLNQLEYLELSFNQNQITDISSFLYLANLYHIQELKIYLNQNQIQDLSKYDFLGSIQLLKQITIDMSNNVIGDDQIHSFQRSIMQLQPVRVQQFNIDVSNNRMTELKIKEVNRIGKLYYGDQKFNLDY